MSTQEKVHEQSRWELAAAFLVGVLVVALAVALIAWALTTPVSDPRNDGDPRPAVTEFAVHPHSA